MRNKDKVPAAALLERPKAYQAEPNAEILGRWAQTVLAEAQDATTIEIYGAIGEDFWSDNGWTPDRLSKALGMASGRDIKVKINSPGGDVFDGIAMFNQLRDYSGAVNVEVMGIAASAASVIAMAGDTITMGVGAMFMIHNAWGIVVGNRHDMADAISALTKIDGAMADIYAARTGLKAAEASDLMDAETYLSAAEAVDKGFADAASAELKATKAEDNPKTRALMARRRAEAALAKDGIPRAERTAMIESLALRDASQPPAERDAGDLTALLSLSATLKGITTTMRA